MKKFWIKVFIFISVIFSNVLNNLAIADININEINKKEDNCINKSTYSYEIRNCMYDSNKLRRIDIDNYIKKLKIVSNKTEFDYIMKSQNLWQKQIEKDSVFIYELIYNHPGTIHFDIATACLRELIISREEFLKFIYYIISDNNRKEISEYTKQEKIKSSQVLKKEVEKNFKLLEKAVIDIEENNKTQDYDELFINGRKNSSFKLKDIRENQTSWTEQNKSDVQLLSYLKQNKKISEEIFEKVQAKLLKTRTILIQDTYYVYAEKYAD